MLDPPDPGRIPALCARLETILREREIALLLCDLGEATSPSCATIEALARLRLLARRHGCGFHLLDPCAELRDLVALTGLEEVLLLEPGREAEEREEPRRVEEEGDGAQPPP